MWHRNRFIGVLCRGKKEDVVRQFTAADKADTEQTYAGIIQARFTMIENAYSFYLLDWCHTLRHTHSDKIYPVEGKGLLQPGGEAG